MSELYPVPEAPPTTIVTTTTTTPRSLPETGNDYDALVGWAVALIVIGLLAALLATIVIRRDAIHRD